MGSGLCAQKVFSDHPCFYGSAKARWGRIHLPVAPHCNVQCNFCNRLYDCANESRPAVTKAILDPSGVQDYLRLLLKRVPDISVVGIAGPGDPLCEPKRTLDTLRAVHSLRPDLLLCVSTNGLNLAPHVDDLTEAGVTHVTVTMNAVDPNIGEQIYSWIKVGTRTYRGVEAAEILLSRQKEAITELKKRGGVMVKVNTVVLPGINDVHVEAVAREAARLGADVMNCIPLIAVPDTLFENLEAPTEAVMDRTRATASLHMAQMYHCRRCRSDAAGLLGSHEASAIDTE